MNGNERKDFFRERFSAAVLAGGKSSRMGKDKTELPFQGMTLLEYQAARIQEIGISDVMISGKKAEIPGTRDIRDVYPGQGPLAGLHACLCSALRDNCLLIGTDTPLVPRETLETLLAEHSRGDQKITMLVHGDCFEPLIAVYCRDLAETAEKMLEEGKRSMRELIRNVPCWFVNYSGNTDMLLNCNTQQEYQRLLMLVREKEKGEK